MYSKLLENRDKILEEWIKVSKLDIEEVEIRLQFSKLLDAIFKNLEDNNLEIDSILDNVLESSTEYIIKYEIDPKEFVLSFTNLIEILSQYIDNINDFKLLSKFINSLSIEIYDKIIKEQNKTIQKQIETIRHMDIPILKLDKETILIPLIGFIDSEKSMLVMRKILNEIKKSNIKNVIVDIEGVPVVDTEVANQFLKLHRAIKIIGAKLIMSGLSPSVAETMVHLGIDLPIKTTSTLELAIQEFRDEI